ncbi:CDP-alcohol phosphatidyltransferase family protein [Candidatus Kuenenbacteria bacterium]|nr:CDP-alcohol phosphatidyltransferase family protein [Candidatus Kuenenbacteria bacterium]
MMILKKIDIWLDKLNVKIQESKDKLLRPVLFFLRKIGFTANILSTLKVVVACLAVYIARENLIFAAWVFMGVYFLDVLDGSMARYMGKNSDRGKFIDVFTDQAIYTLIVFTLILIDFLDIKALAYNLLVVPVLYLFVIIERNEGKPTDWVIKPVAKLTYYKILILGAALMVVFGWGSKVTANWVLYFTNFLVTLHLIHSYGVVIKRKA